MPDVSLTEFAIIALVVLIVFGPKRLPEISRKAGQWARELRSISREFRRGIEREVAVINEPLREIKKDLAGPIDQVKKDLEQPLRDLGGETEKPAPDGDTAGTGWIGPVPSTGPTPSESMEDLERIESGDVIDVEVRETDKVDRLDIGNGEPLGTALATIEQ